ncbi:DUF6778 family protein [Neotabrizicola sp. VNH66]|uniref:DUF6778 family protein n=1 Tax=Neotabrizicola sp. VNH66 TaxID=3400918 RepID=UPI003BFD7E57
MQRFGTAVKLGTALGLVAALAACGSGGPATRAATPAPHGVTLATAGGGKPGHGVQTVTMPLEVRAVTVTVPRDLRVSEAEVFYPIADIVWRGEPRGDRYAQIQAIYDEAATAAVAPLKSGIPVVAEIEVTRFHCVTDKTRYTFGGVHSLHFLLTIRHAETGEILSGPRVVNADVAAPGGQAAVKQDYEGITQRDVVRQRLANVIRRELKALNVDPAVAGLTARGAADPVALAAN